MKKNIKLFFVLLLSFSIVIPSFTIVSRAEENQNDIDGYSISTEMDMQPDPLENANYSMGGNSNTNDYVEPYNLATRAAINKNAIGSGHVKSNTLNVRSGPSTSDSKIGVLNNGDYVEVYGRTNSWYKIAYNNDFAYVSSSYISLNVLEKGIDVSKWNGEIDWNKVKADGIDYVIIRGGYGTSNTDPKFKSYIEGASNAGLKIGIYWFSYATSPEIAKLEAEKCLQVISPYKNKITYPIFYDYEYASVDYAVEQNITITKELATQMANSFLNTIKSAGYDTGLYTNNNFSSMYFSTDILDNNNLWIAQYNSQCTFSKPYMMWQYSNKGRVNGISSDVDMNYTYLKPMNSNNTVEDTSEIYHLNINSFLGEYNAKVALKQLQDETGWYAQYNKMDAIEYYYQIKTGGFVGEDNVKAALNTLYNTIGLKGYYKNSGEYIGGSKTPVYRIETGGFIGEDNVKNALKWLQDTTGWWATYVPNGSYPNSYKIITGGFVGEDNVKDALKWLQDTTGWWAIYVFNGDYYETPSTPVYNIYVDEILTENSAKYYLDELVSKTGWYATYSKTQNYENHYEIITGGFLGLSNAQRQSEYVKNRFGWYNTIVKE